MRYPQCGWNSYPLPENFVTAQKVGARDIMTFRAMADQSIGKNKDSAEFAKLTGLTIDQVDGVLSICESNEWQRRIDTIAGEIEKCNEAEQNTFKAA